METMTTRYERSPEYGLAAHLRLPAAEARAKVEAALKEEGFGVLTEIDVKATLKKKLDKDIAPYVILGACNPVIAHRALEAEPGIGLVLPCNVVLREEAGGTTVWIARADAMFRIVGNPALAPIAADAQARLERVAAALRA